MEEWKPIGLGNHMISNFGIVKNGDKIRKPQIVGDGHLQISITISGVRKYFYIHRLVGIHFLQKTNADQCLIDHIDRKKTNNHFSNLRWVTHQENCNNRYDNKEPTEEVLKHRQVCLEYKRNNPDKTKIYQKKHILTGNKNKNAKLGREISHSQLI